MRRLHYVFKLGFQLFYIRFAELLLQISCPSLFLAQFRLSGAARCALEFLLVTLTFLAVESSNPVLETFFLSFTLIFNVSRKQK